MNYQNSIKESSIIRISYISASNILANNVYLFLQQCSLPKFYERKVLNTSAFPRDRRHLIVSSPQYDEKCTCQFLSGAFKNFSLSALHRPISAARVTKTSQRKPNCKTVRHTASLGNTGDNWIHECWRKRERNRCVFKRLRGTMERILPATLSAYEE